MRQRGHFESANVLWRTRNLVLRLLASLEVTLLLTLSTFSLLLSLFCSLSFAEETSAYAKALAAYQDRQLDEAFTHAKQAVKNSSQHADAHVLLGELYYLRQDLEKAKQTWEKALKLVPSRQDVRERLEKVKKEMQVEERFSHNDTHPFVVRFDRNEMVVDSGVLRQFLWDVYRQLGRRFEYFPDHPITVILYPEEGFDQVKGVSHQAAGLYDGKIRLPIRRGSAGSGFSASAEMKRVLWHEYTHAIVQDLAKGRCPLWLNEGVATLQESSVSGVDLDQVRKSFEAGTLIPWAKLFDEKEYQPSSLELYYQESYLVVRYLTDRWGWRGLSLVLTRLGEGYPLTDAIRSEYKVDFSILEKEWLKWLRIRYT